MPGPSDRNLGDDPEFDGSHRLWHPAADLLRWGLIVPTGFYGSQPPQQPPTLPVSSQEERPMPPRDRHFWIMLGLWGSALVTVFGAGLYAFIDDSPRWGFGLCAVGLLGLIAMTFYLGERKIPRGDSVILGAMLAFTWLFFAYTIWHGGSSDQRSAIEKPGAVAGAAGSGKLTEQSPGIALISGLTDANFEGSPLGFWWNGGRLDIIRLPPQPPQFERPVVISDFGVRVKNLGIEDVKMASAYLVSGVDGTKIPMQILSIDGLITTDEAGPIPPKAQFNLVVPFNLPETEFVKKWADFSVVVQTDTQKVVHEVTWQSVRDQLDQFHPERLPHVSKVKP